MAEFERLTKHYARGKVKINDVCCTHFDSIECLVVCGECSRCEWNEKAWDRLAAYENTGLSPEQVATYKKALEVFWEADPARDVYYITDGEIHMMGGNTVLLLLQKGIVNYYDTREEARAALERMKKDG